MLTTRDRTRPVRQWLMKAIGEVILIFVGITLAIAFENWNAERAERAQERSTLAELHSNLAANRDVLRSDLESNSLLLARIDTVISHIEARRPYSDQLSTALTGLDNWISPFLSRAAYETLKSRGFDLIADPVLRAKVVHLYESVYAILIDDWDRSEWINYEVSMAPLMLAHIEELSNAEAKPLDYEALLDDRSFRSALRRTAALREVGILLTQRAIDATDELIAVLDGESVQ